MGRFEDRENEKDCGIEFYDRLGQLGDSGTQLLLRRLLGDNRAMRRLVRVLPGLLGNQDLVHGVFTPADEILRLFKKKCYSKGIKLDQFIWDTPQAAPEFTQDKGVAVVLNATMESLQDTFNFGMECLADGHEGAMYPNDRFTHPEFLRLCNDHGCRTAGYEPPKFQPWRIGWCRIKLNHFDSLMEVHKKGLRIAPGCSSLFAAAQHPARLHVIDHYKFSGFWLAGLEYLIPESGRQSAGPGCVEVSLHSGSGGGPCISVQEIRRNYNGLCVPLLVED